MRLHVLFLTSFFITMIGACTGGQNEPDLSAPVQYRLRQIMLEPTVSQEREESIRREAEECLAQALDQTDFTELAKKLSQEPSAKETGGDLGYFVRAQMVKPFSDAVFSMKPGEIRGPVKTQFGYHIIKLLDTDGEKRHAQHILFMLTPGREDSLATLSTLKDIRRRILDGADFGDMVREYVTENMIRESEGYMVWQTPEDMLPSFREAIEGLREGDVSEPFESIIGFHIVKVDSINYNADRLLEGFPAYIDEKLRSTNKQP